jgi:hypothetical protein
MKRTFAALLRLYPRGYRELFADEMMAVFEDARLDSKSRGWLPYCTFLLAETAGILRGAALARSLGIWNNRVVSGALPFVAGGIVSVPFMRPLLYDWRRVRPIATLGYSHDEVVMLMALAAVSVLLIAAFSIAFVINMRSLAERRSCGVKRHA